MGDLKGWLLGIREKSREIGEIAFHQTEIKREEWRKISETDAILSSATFNSALERVYNEQDDCDLTSMTMLIIVDPLNNEQIVVDFRPLYEAMHIYASLNKGDDLQRTYEADRRKQMDLLLPAYVHLDEEGVPLHDLLAEVTGFCIIERATSAKLPDFRSVSQIEGLWDLMCTQVIDLISDAVSKINDPKVLLTVKDSVTLFMQTIQVCDRHIFSLT
jgi:hypothetical protein